MSNGASMTLSTELDRLKRTLTQRVERLRKELQEAEDNFNSVARTIKLLGEEPVSSFSGIWDDTYLRGFEGLTQVQALIKLATESGKNRFKIAEAKSLLLAAGLIKSKKNASNILHNTIQRSERFKRVAVGEYELILKPVVATSTVHTENLKRVG
jgi:hypothetical protein